MKLLLMRFAKPSPDARDSDRTKSNSLEVEKALSLKKFIVNILHAVLDVGEDIAGGSSPGRVLSDQER